MTPAPALLRPSAVVDDVEVDDLVTAVRRCRDVEDLLGGSPTEVATYLPGRRVAGVRITPDAVLVQVRVRWNVPAANVAAEIRRAVTGVVPGRRVDVVIADVGDPPATPVAPATGRAHGRESSAGAP